MNESDGLTESEIGLDPEIRTIDEIIDCERIITVDREEEKERRGFQRCRNMLLYERNRIQSIFSLYVDKALPQMSTILSFTQRGGLKKYIISFLLGRYVVKMAWKLLATLEDSEAPLFFTDRPIVWSKFSSSDVYENVVRLLLTDISVYDRFCKLQKKEIETNSESLESARWQEASLIQTKKMLNKEIQETLIDVFDCLAAKNLFELTREDYEALMYLFALQRPYSEIFECRPDEEGKFDFKFVCCFYDGMRREDLADLFFMEINGIRTAIP